MNPDPTFIAALVKMAAFVGITEAELRDAFAPLVETVALKRVRAHRAGALLLLGDPGTGKTLAALRWLIAPWLDPDNWEHDGWVGSWRYRFVTSRWFRTARSLAQVDQYNTAQMDRLLNVRNLVVDDLGQEYLDKAGFLASLIDHLVTERHRRQLPTILTANLGVAEFVARYGARSLDRIGEAGIKVCDGGSLRRGTASLNRTIPGIDWAAVATRIGVCELARDASEAQARQAARGRR